MTPLGTYLASLYPDPNYNDPNNLYNYVYHSLEPQNREEMKMRFDWNVSNNTKAFVRISRDPATRREPARRRGGRPLTSRCRRRTWKRSSAGPTTATSSRC